jgi:hypothetical protein
MGETVHGIFAVDSGGRVDRLELAGQAIPPAEPAATLFADSLWIIRC